MKIAQFAKKRELADAKPLETSRLRAASVPCDTACENDCSQSCGCESSCEASCGCNCSNERKHR